MKEGKNIADFTANLFAVAKFATSTGAAAFYPYYIFLFSNNLGIRRV